LTLDTASIAYDVDMGAGDDTVTLTAALAATAAIDGGAGTDTLSINNATATLLTDAIKDGVTGFETLSVTASTDTIAANVLAFENLVLAASTAATVTGISAGMASGISVTGDQATSLIMSLSSTAGTGDTYGLTLDHTTADTDIDIADLQIAGAEVLNIVSNGTTTAANQNSIEFGDESTSLKTITITGSSEFGLTMDGGTETFTAAAVTVNASGLDAKASINLTGNTSTETITGTAKVDTITGGSGASTIDAGAGGDTINVSSDIDTITTGAGADTVAFSTLSADATDKAVITEFTAGSGGDVISIDESAAAGAIATDMTAGTTVYLEMAVGAIGANDSATTQTNATVYVITDKSFANYDALEVEIDLEKGGTDSTDSAYIFLNSTSGMAEMYIDGVVGTTTTDEVLIAQFSNMTTIAQMDDFVAGNFVIA